MHRCRFARLLRFLAAALALAVLAWPLRAAADETAAELPPRDVSVVVQPGAAKLPPLPGDFERLDHGWVAIELPSSLHDRGEALASRGRRLPRATLGGLRRAFTRGRGRTRREDARADERAGPRERPASRVRRGRRVSVPAPRAPRPAGAADLGRAGSRGAVAARADARGAHRRRRWPPRAPLVRRGARDPRVRRGALGADEDALGRDARQAPPSALVPRPRLSDGQLRGQRGVRRVGRLRSLPDARHRPRALRVSAAAGPRRDPLRSDARRRVWRRRPQARVRVARGARSPVRRDPR